MDEEACGSKSQFPYGSTVLRSCESSSSTLQRSEGATASGASCSQAQKVQATLIMGLETVIKDPLKTYSAKVQALLAAWGHVAIYIKICTAEDTTTSIIEWINGHSLKLIFQGEWPQLCNAMRTHLTVTIQSCCTALASNRCCESKLKTLINLVHNPWGHSVLERLFQRVGGNISDEDVVAFCEEEEMTTLAIRLETLCDSECEDLAFRLARICSRYVRLKGLNGNDSVAGPHVTYITDVYIVLLYKRERIKHILALLKSIKLEEGAVLVKRFVEVRACEPQQIWRNSLNVAELSAQYFLTKAMVKPFNEIEHILTVLMNQWTMLQGDTISPTLPDNIRKLIKQAGTAQHIYAFCRVLSSRFGKAMKTLCIELYIQGLTSDMNQVEQAKATKDPVKVSLAQDRLSQGFLELGSLMADNVGVSRECVLTAFSIFPTRACYLRLKELSKAQPDWPTHVVDTGQPHRGIKTNLSKPGTKRCVLHPPFDPGSGLPPGELCYTCGSFTGMEPNPDGKKIRTLGALIKGDTMTKSRNYDVFAAPSIVLEAKSLGLSDQVLDDLSVVLSGPRYLPLSWAFDWGELSASCKRYLETGDMRNKDTELKYLNIDYNQFKDWPRNSDATDDSSGIEKGYEDCVTWPEDEEEEETTKTIRTVATKAYKRLVVVGVESDSSLDRKRRSRSLKSVRRLDIDSENDSGSGLKKQYATQSSSISGYDTGTQDSITDSLGSDGCRLDKPKGTTKKTIAKRVGKKKVKETYTATLNEKLSRRDVSREVPGNKVMSIFKVDENGEKVGSTHGTRPAAPNGKLLDKRVSDPNVVKSLRMFRHHNSKKTIQSIQSAMDSKTQPTYSPMVSTLSITPRIILQRAEDSSPKKPLTPNNLQIDPGLILRKSGNSKNSFQLTSKGGTAYDETSGAQSALDCELIKAGIPGLNTLELLVPPISEATVQVVQLPRNPPAPSSGTNGASILRTQPPKASGTAQGSASGSGECAASSSTAPTVTLASLLQSRETPQVVTLLEEIARPVQTVLLGTRAAGRSETVRGEPSKESTDANAGGASSSKATTKTAAITAHIQKIGRPPILDAGPKPVNLSVSHSDPGQFARATATVTSGEVQMQPAQYVLMQTETGERAQTFPAPTERQPESPSPAEGLPKFHHAFSNKASRSIYCQTNPAEASQSTPVPEETEPNPAAQSSSSAFQPVTTTTPSQIPIATPTQPKPVQAKTSGTIIHSGMLQTLLAAQPMIRDNLVMTSRGPILRLFRAPSRHTPSMVYIGTTNSKAPQISNTNPSHVNPPSPAMKIVRISDLAPQAGSSSQERTVVPAVSPSKDSTGTSDRSLGRSKFHTGLVTTIPTTGNTTAAPPEPQICILDSSSDDEIDHVSHPVLQNTLVKTADTPTSGVIQLQNVGRSRLTSFSAIQNYPSTATKDAETDEVDRGPLKLSGALNSTPVESASSSLEQQLLEFDVVLKQFTETSKMKEKGEIQPDGTHQAVQGGVTISSGSEFPVTHIPCLKVPTVSRMLPVPASVVKTPTKVTKVVMVSSNCQAVVSPSISISSSSSSPCISTSSSAGKTSPSKSPKSSKSKSIKTSPSTSTGGSKASPIPKPQQKPQEDEQTAQRIYAILDDYAEQIRNSPDLNNKPAPRRRSNPPTNPSQNSKRKKSSHSKVKLLGQQSSSTTTEMSPGVDDPSLLGSEDSCSNMMSMSQVQDSPAVSQAGDETTALDSSSEGGNLKSVVTESGDPPEPRHTLLCGVQGMLFKDGTSGVGDKSLLMGSTGSMPIYMHGNVRQMLMQGLKGHKVIRVQQVSVPGTPGTSGMPAATLVLRQMIPPSTATSVFGQQQQSQQGKLPAGTISSQSLCGVSAQPPVVVPIGSHPLATSDAGLLCVESPVAESPLVYHPRSSEPENVVSSPSVREEPTSRLLSVVTQSPVSLTAEPAPSLQSSPSTVRRCLALSFSSQSTVPVITNSHFQLTDNSECDMQVEVSERSGFSLGAEPISMGGSIQMATNPEAATEQDPSMDRLQASHLMHSQTRNQSEPLFQTVNSSSATTTGLSEQLFSEECGGGSAAPASSTVNNEAAVAENKLPPRPQPAGRSPHETIAAKRKSDTEPDQVYGKRKFPERWGEEGNAESAEGVAGQGVVVCTDTLEKSVEGKDQEVELLAHDSWSDGGGSEDSARPNRPRTKSLLKNRLLMKSLESGASKSANLVAEQKLQTDSSENQTTFEEKSKQTKQAKRKGRRAPKKDTGSMEPAKRSKRLNLMQQSTLTDSTGTSEVDSSENLASTFDRLHKQKGKEKTGDNLSHLLVPYRKKSANRVEALKGFCASRTEGVMMMGNEVIATAQLTDSTSEVEEATGVRPQQFLSTNKLESEEKKVGRRSRLEGIRFTEVLLHKSLSEECEDLGVDRPSTSELFPEADLLLDTNSSPGFDATLQDASCSQSVVEPIFTEFPLPPTYYSSTSEEGNSNDSKPKTSARPKVEGQKIGTRSVRAGLSVDKKGATGIAHKPVTRRATKNIRGKKAKSGPDVNGSQQSVEPVNGGDGEAREPDSTKDATAGDAALNGGEPDDKTPSAFRETKAGAEARPAGAKVAKSVTDNEYSNTDASPGDSMFGTESSSEDSNLARDCCGPKRPEVENVDSGETWESTSSQDKAGADDEDSGSSRHFSPESFAFAGAGANGLGDADPKPAPKSNKMKHICKVEPSDFKRSSKRIKKIMSRRRCRSLEPQCVLLDVVDLTREGTKVRHLRHSSQRGHRKKPCSCCNGTEEQLKKKDDLDKLAATAKKCNSSKLVVKGNNAKKR